MNTFHQLTQRRDHWQAICAKHGATLNKLSEGNQNAMGLTSDAVKASPEWKAARQGYDHAAKHAREINRILSKHFKKELRAETELRRAIMRKQPIFSPLGGMTNAK